MGQDEDELIEDQCCPIHRKPCEARKEDNYFFALSKYQQPLEELLSSNPNFVRPNFRMNEVCTSTSISNLSVLKLQIALLITFQISACGPDSFQSLCHYTQKELVCGWFLSLGTYSFPAKGFAHASLIHLLVHAQLYHYLNIRDKIAMSKFSDSGISNVSALQNYFHVLLHSI